MMHSSPEQPGMILGFSRPWRGLFSCVLSDPQVMQEKSITAHAVECKKDLQVQDRPQQGLRLVRRV